MKVFKLLSIALAAMAVTSCNSVLSDRIVDWYPVSLTIQVRDSQGHDRLDPAVEGNWAESVAISYKGETYHSVTLPEKQSEIGTKAYLATIYGLLCVKTESHSGYCLSFGEIDGADDMDEDLVLTWPDGTTNTIHYHCSKHNERKLSCKRWFKLDGVKQDNAYFSFVK